MENREPFLQLVTITADAKTNSNTQIAKQFNQSNHCLHLVGEHNVLSHDHQSPSQEKLQKKRSLSPDINEGADRLYNRNSIKRVRHNNYTKSSSSTDSNLKSTSSPITPITTLLQNDNNSKNNDKGTITFITPPSSSSSNYIITPPQQQLNVDADKIIHENATIIGNEKDCAILARWKTFVKRINFPALDFQTTIVPKEYKIHTQMAPGVLLKKEEFSNLENQTALINSQLITQGFFKYKIEGVCPISIADDEDGEIDNLGTLKSGDRWKGFEIRFQLMEIFKLSDGIFFYKKHDSKNAMKLLQSLETWTIADIEELYGKLFQRISNSDNTLLFDIIINCLPVDIHRSGKGLLVPFITIYDNVDINNDVLRTGIDLTTLPNPLRRLHFNRFGKTQKKPGITIPLTNIGFPGTSSPSAIGEAYGLNRIVILEFGEPMNWIITSPRYFEKAKRMLWQELNELGIDRNDPIISTQMEKCIFQHENLFVSPAFFYRHKIPFTIVNQSEGEVLVIAAKSISSAICNGLNCSKIISACLADFHVKFNFGQHQCNCSKEIRENYPKANNNSSTSSATDIDDWPYFIPITGKEKSDKQQNLHRFLSMIHSNSVMQRITNNIQDFTNINKNNNKHQSQNTETGEVSVLYNNPTINIAVLELLGSSVKSFDEESQLLQTVDELLGSINYSDNNDTYNDNNNADNEGEEEELQWNQTCDNDDGNKKVKQFAYKHTKFHDMNLPDRYTINMHNTKQLLEWSRALLTKTELDSNKQSKAKNDRNYCCRNCKLFCTTKKAFEDHVKNKKCGKYGACKYPGCTSHNDSWEKFETHRRTHLSEEEAKKAKQEFLMEKATRKMEKEKIGATISDNTTTNNNNVFKSG